MLLNHEAAMTMTDTSCAWALKTPLELEYHNTEWGVPLRDERALFELLILEGAQAGLSWSTILHKRENYRRAFHDFDAATIARYTGRDCSRLMKNEGIVRNRLKIDSTITNAKAVLKLREDEGGLARWLWAFVDDQPIVNRRTTMMDIPPRTELSDQIAKALAKRGFKFVGSTIIYAYLQAAGLVNDHLVTCERHAACAALH
jgi:DNA-3-methyladenine glycosylase I